MILHHRFPFQLSNRTCATALSVCVCRIPFQPLLSPLPPPLTLSLCISYFASATTLRAAERGCFVSVFSNSLPHCKNQGIRQPSRPTKQDQSLVRDKKKSSPLAAVGATFTPLLADEAAAECGQAGFQASSVLPIFYDDLLGRSLVRFVRLLCVPYKGRVSRMGS
jgi:hypothetical protein